MSLVTGTNDPDNISGIFVSFGVTGGPAATGADTIHGLGGNDTLVGGAGGDHLAGGGGRDDFVIQAGSGLVTIWTSTAAWTACGSPARPQQFRYASAAAHDPA